MRKELHLTTWEQLDRANSKFEILWVERRKKKWIQEGLCTYLSEFKNSCPNKDGSIEADIHWVGKNRHLVSVKIQQEKVSTRNFDKCYQLCLDILQQVQPEVINSQSCRSDPQINFQFFLPLVPPKMSQDYAIMGKCQGCFTKIIWD